jgi:hypothetical protein
MMNYEHIKWRKQRYWACDYRNWTTEEGTPKTDTYNLPSYGDPNTCCKRRVLTPDLEVKI